MLVVINDLNKKKILFHLRRIKPTVVRLGDQNLLTTDDGAFPVDYEIKRIVKHPQYSMRTKENDIALIELKNNVSFNNLTRPACLNQFDVDSGGVVAVSFKLTFFTAITELFLFQDWLGPEFFIRSSNRWASKSKIGIGVEQWMWIDLRQRRQKDF